MLQLAGTPIIKSRQDVVAAVNAAGNFDVTPATPVNPANSIIIPGGWDTHYWNTFTPAMNLSGYWTFSGGNARFVCNSYTGAGAVNVYGDLIEFYGSSALVQAFSQALNITTTEGTTDTTVGTAYDYTKAFCIAADVRLDSTQFASIIARPYSSSTVRWTHQSFGANVTQGRYGWLVSKK